MTLDQDSLQIGREPVSKGRRTRLAMVRLIGALLGVLISIGILIPAWFNVDQYRSLVARELEKRIHGRVELGKLSLSLWGRVAVGVAGVRVLDSAGGTVLKVSEAAFQFPIWPLLSGKPVLQFEMNRPEVHLVRSAAGTFNLAALFQKERDSSAPRAALPAPQGSASTVEQDNPSEEFRIPGIAAAARLGVLMREASLDWTDEKSGASGLVDRLNFRLENLSLSETALATLWGDLDARSPGGATVQGVIRLQASLAPGLSADRKEVSLYNITLSGDFSKLDVRVPGKLQKAAGIPASLQAKATLSESQWKLEELLIKLQASSLRLSGTYIPATGAAAGALVDFKLAESSLELGELAALAPSLKLHEIQGRAMVTGSLSGPTDRLTYSGGVELSGLQFQSPAFKVKPVVALKLDISTDQVDQLRMTLQSPGNELQLSGKLISFTAPRAEFRLQSSGLDLDQLLVSDSAPSIPSATVSTLATAPSVADPEGAPPEAVLASEQGEDWDAWLAEHISAEWIRKASVKMDADLQSLKFRGVALESINAATTLRGLVLSLQKGSFKVFDGKGSLDARIDLKSSPPQYQFSAQARELDLQKAFESKFTVLKNTVVGLARFSVEGSGSSLNAGKARQNLMAGGSFEVGNATFVTVDLSKVAIDGLNSAIAGMSTRIPPLAGLKFDPPGAEEIRYETISARFAIADGLFKMSDFSAKSQAPRGVDVRGGMDVAMTGDHALAGRWEIIDTHNFTHARELSVEVAGVRVDNLLAEGKGPVKFPVSVGCTASSPCFSYAEAPEYLGRIALGKMEKAAGKKLGVKLKAAAESGIKELEKKASPGIKKTLKGLKDLLKK